MTVILRKKSVKAMKRIVLIIALMHSAGVYAQTETADTIKERQLEEVVVKGTKPAVRAEDGVMVVDLPEIVKDKPVSNILEALGYLPGVKNADGSIGLAGASDVTIIINGEVTNIPTENLYQLLNNTPVDRLRKVEIMYSAPAKYHANGAVINVVLKTPRPIDGLQGQVRAGFNQAHYGSAGGAFAATYAIREWSFDLNYGLSRSKSWSQEQTWSNHLYDGRRIMIEDRMRHISRDWNNIIYASAAWKTLMLTYNGQITSDSKSWGMSTGTLGNYVNAHNMLSPVGYHNIAIRYTAPFGMTIGGDYTRYSENRSQSLFKEDEYLLGSENKQDINRGHIYIDRQHQTGKWQMNYGAEYQHSKDHSSQHYGVFSDKPDFDDILSEEVVSVYAGTQRSSEGGLSFNVSVKGEYFHNRYQHNWNCIPQIGATYYTTPRSIFQLNLSSRRVYPQYWQLHGGANYINDYSTVIGNPELQPYMKYDAQLNYILGQKYVVTLYFNYADKATVQLPYQSADALRLVFQTINMNYKRTAGLNLYAPFRAGDVWEADVTANVFNQREKADRFHDISFDNRKWIFYGGVSNTFRPGRGSAVSLTIDVSYISPSLQGAGDLSGLWWVDAGAKWQFGKERCLELNLKADDIFNSSSPTLTINHAGQDYRMKVRDMSRNVKLTMVWRFNGFKPKEREIDTSRFGTVQ